MFILAWVQRKESETKLKRKFACSAPNSVCSQSKYSTRCKGLFGFFSRRRCYYIYFYLTSDCCYIIRKEESEQFCTKKQRKLLRASKVSLLVSLGEQRLPMTFLVPRLQFMETETSHLHLTILGCTLQWHKSLIFSPKPALLKPIKSKERFCSVECRQQF